MKILLDRQFPTGTVTTGSPELSALLHGWRFYSVSDLLTVNSSPCIYRVAQNTISHKTIKVQWIYCIPLDSQTCRD